MSSIEPQDNHIWKALADPTRRALLDVLADGPRTTGQLSTAFPLSRFGVMKHLGVLERAGLVTARRNGRERLNHLNAAPFARLKARWLSLRAENLGDALTRLAAIAEEKDMTDRIELRAAEVALDWTIAASPQDVWATLFAGPDRWWPREMRAGPTDATMTFEERVGGELTELGPNGAGLCWYRVIALDPGKSVDLAGQLASRYGGPATSLLHLTLEPGEQEGTTLLKLTDSVFGRIGEGFHASAAEGWGLVFGSLAATFAG